MPYRSAPPYVPVRKSLIGCCEQLSVTDALRWKSHTGMSKYRNILELEDLPTVAYWLFSHYAILWTTYRAVKGCGVVSVRFCGKQLVNILFTNHDSCSSCTLSENPPLLNADCPSAQVMGIFIKYDLTEACPTILRRYAQSNDYLTCTPLNPSPLLRVQLLKTHKNNFTCNQTSNSKLSALACQLHVMSC